MIRSDSGVAHRLSSSARVLSAVVGQVKAKRQRKKRLWHMHNWRAREFQPALESRLSRQMAANLRAARTTPGLPRLQRDWNKMPKRQYYPDKIVRRAMRRPVSSGEALIATAGTRPASCAGADRRAAGQLRFGSRPIFSRRYRSADRPSVAARPIIAP